MYSLVVAPQDVKNYLYGKHIFSFDIETSPDIPYRDESKAALDPHKSHIVGISFSVEENSGIYVPLTHTTGGNCEDIPELWEYLSELFTNPNVIKCAHNLAFESTFLYARGVIIQAPVYDTIAAAQMTLKGNTGFRTLADSGLKTLVPELFGVNLPSFSEVTKDKHFDELDPQDSETVRYACADSDFALQLYNLFNGWFDKWLPKHRYIVENIESPTAVYVGIMKYNGILVDTELMLTKKAECESRLAKLKDEIHFIIGDVEIGANASTSAFKKYLYDELYYSSVKNSLKTA
jgi:DNA polymerase-1